VLRGAGPRAGEAAAWSGDYARNAPDVPKKNGRALVAAAAVAANLGSVEIEVEVLVIVAIGSAMVLMVPVAARHAAGALDQVLALVGEPGGGTLVDRLAAE